MNSGSGRRRYGNFASFPRTPSDGCRLQPKPSANSHARPGAIKLAGTDDLWRIRVGDFRVVYTIADEALVVIVVRIANRREVYRGF